mgnify:CR=1 FL=1
MPASELIYDWNQVEPSFKAPGRRIGEARAGDVLLGREKWAKAGIERATEFTWGRSADILEDAYRHALETTL